MRRILNRRNAVVGWFAWKVARRAARKRARRHSHLLRFVGVGSALALVVGAVVIGLSRGSSID